MSGPAVWEQATIAAVPRSALSRLSAALFQVGAAGLQEDAAPGSTLHYQQPWDTAPPPPPPDPVWVHGWFEDADHGVIAAAVQRILPSASLTWSAVPDTDWEAESRASFAPLHISDRLVVSAPWDAPEGAVLIEPGEGFGTGHHPTTLAGLVAVDALADEVHTVLDVGCGSGVLALAAAHLGCRAEGIDVDPDALANARHNAGLNGLDVPFHDTAVANVPGRWDLVVANLYAELLSALAAPIAARVGQHLVLAGVLVEREALVRDAFDPAFGSPERFVDGEWVSLRYRRRAL